MENAEWGFFKLARVPIIPAGHHKNKMNVMNQEIESLPLCTDCENLLTEYEAEQMEEHNEEEPRCYDCFCAHEKHVEHMDTWNTTFPQ